MKFTPFQWDDALHLDQQLTDEERAIRDAAREYCQEKLFPRVIEANRHEKFHREIMNEMGEMGSSAPRSRATAAPASTTSATG